MNNILKEVFVTMKSTRTLDFAKELINKYMKWKAYDYSSHGINKAYDWLIADNSQAMSFLEKDEKLRKYWAKDFYESLHDQGEGFWRPC